jgi:DNA-binding MarR family transcriptional regulator
MESTSEELAQSIVRRLLVLLRYQHRFGHLMQRTHGVSGRQLSALRYLARDGPRSVSEVSRYLYIGDGTTSPMLERLERAGLVVRERCKRDARRVMVQVTDSGRQVCQEAPSGLFGRLRADLPQLPAGELAEMDAALERILTVAQLDESLLE